VPLFALTQHIAYGGHLEGQEARAAHWASLDAMEQFAGFESAIYAAMMSGGRVREMASRAREPLLEALLAMMAYSRQHAFDSGSSGIAGRARYRPLVVQKIWLTRAELEGPEALFPELRSLVERPPHPIYREIARQTLGRMLARADRLEEAVAVWREQALGRDTARSVPGAMIRIAMAGARQEDPAIVGEARALGERMLRAIDAGHYLADRPERAARIAHSIRHHVYPVVDRYQRHLATRRRKPAGEESPDERTG